MTRDTVKNNLFWFSKTHQYSHISLISHISLSFLLTQVCIHCQQCVFGFIYFQKSVLAALYSSEGSVMEVI